MVRIKNRKRGFTLVETVVSFALLAIVASVLVGVFLTSNRAVDSAIENERINGEVLAYVRDVNGRGEGLVTETREDAEIVFTFEGISVSVKGKIVVFVYRGETLVEYRVFE